MSALTDPDAWQARSDRVARLVLLPMLAVSTALAVLDSGGHHSWFAVGHGPVGLVVLALTTLWSAGLSRYPTTGVPPVRQALVFGAHVLLAGALVWVNPWYGVFAVSGYFFADELPGRRRKVGFIMVAAVLAASQTDGYPLGWDTHTLAYVMMAGFNMLAVLIMVNLTYRVMAQNAERGRMIEELGETNRRLEESMTENAGLHAQLLVQAREAGILEERHRLAGEIHDTLAQGLAGIVAQVQAARQARHDEAEWGRHLDLAASLARANLTEARRSVRALRPEQLEQATLPEAIGALARGWSEHSSIPAEIETTGIPAPAGADVEAALFRVAQEALANVAKHAGASKVHLTLSYLDDMLLLDIADDGTGFAPADRTDRTDGYGLAGMRRRVERLSGSLNLESTPGYGTTVNATVPVQAQVPAPAPAPAPGHNVARGTAR